jgi:anhydro-N-acetylmuramic acid kinase
MSGTSLDGVDGVLVDFSAQRPQVLGFASLPFTDSLKAEFLALNVSGADELHRAALAGNALARLYADVVALLLSQCSVPASAVRAVGAHGQTVRHQPQEFDGTGYTLQINQPALVAELCGIAVVADFRSRDIAAGGQGAPLVPPFHAAFFGQGGAPVAVLNIGGISNITLLNPSSGVDVLGFDCGPGNALMDGWCFAHTGQPFDDRGQWAASGQVHPRLLAQLLSEPFFAAKPPKSTGRDLFNRRWLDAHLARLAEILPPQDVQATLTELTAQACAQSLLRYAPGCESLIVCGGGALNSYLMQRLAVALGSKVVQSSENFGLPPLQVEATAFAWLARQTVLGKTGSLKSVTGARGARILGAIYPA